MDAGLPFDAADAETVGASSHGSSASPSDPLTAAAAAALAASASASASFSMPGETIIPGPIPADLTPEEKFLVSAFHSKVMFMMAAHRRRQQKQDLDAFRQRYAGSQQHKEEADPTVSSAIAPSSSSAASTAAGPPSWLAKIYEQTLVDSGGGSPSNVSSLWSALRRHGLSGKSLVICGRFLVDSWADAADWLMEGYTRLSALLSTALFVLESFLGRNYSVRRALFRWVVALRQRMEHFIVLLRLFFPAS